MKVHFVNSVNSIQLVGLGIFEVGSQKILRMKKACTRKNDAPSRPMTTN